MLPDGAHLRAEDWTVFYLNRRTQGASALANGRISSTAAGHRATQPLAQPCGENGREILFVLNCVKMKEDKSVRR